MKFLTWLQKQSRNKKVVPRALSGALVLALILIIFTFRNVIWLPAPTVEPESSETQSPVVVRDVLTGINLAADVTGEVTPQMRAEWSRLPLVYSAMIDHSSEAWPQAGLDQAFLVIEAPVEAAIPRLQAFFDDRATVAKIGPVRSARPYFVDWANELDALYLHVGGSNEALEKIANNGTWDLNQFWNGASYWRSTDRLAPHNVYTSSEKLAALFANKAAAGDLPVPLYGGWKFKDGAASGIEPVLEPTIVFSGLTYTATWKYMADNRYQRWQAGKIYQMQDGAKIYADNVVVVITDIQVIDAVGRRQVRTLGEGEAVVFQDGQALLGTWRKPAVGERLRFYDAAGQEIIMNAGVTWIEVIPEAQMLQY